MILGFAHITQNVVSDWAHFGVRIPNAPEKWPLMAYQATVHRMRVPELPGLRQEVIWYDTGVAKQPSRLEFMEDRVAYKARDLDVEAAFFRGLGFDADGDGRFVLASSVPQWRLWLLPWGTDDAPIDPPLDIAGYAALAFYSSDVEADRDHLLKHGGRTPTEPFMVKLDREMKIVMLRSTEGTIIELIQVLPG